jgi:DinB superfamily
MEFDLDGTGKILARTPRVVRALLEELPEALVRANYGSETWSPHEIIAHLIHCEKTDWMPRARHILQSGEAVAFAPFDRNGHVALCRENTTGALLDLLESLRRANLAELHSMSLKPEDLARRGRHPALGPVTLSQLLAAWVVHDLNHIAQTCKAIAFQHQSEVGPWKAYLSILSPPSPS